MKDKPLLGTSSWTPKGRRVESRDPEEVAITLFGILANSPERLSRFMALTGIAPQDLRLAAQEPRFSAAVLDYVAADERLLLEIAAESGLSPSSIALAHAALNAPDDDAT